MSFFILTLSYNKHSGLIHYTLGYRLHMRIKMYFRHVFAEFLSLFQLVQSRLHSYFYHVSGWGSMCHTFVYCIAAGMIFLTQKFSLALVPVTKTLRDCSVGFLITAVNKCVTFCSQREFSQVNTTFIIFEVSMRPWNLKDNVEL